MSGSSLRDRYAGTISTARRSRGPTRGRRALFESLEPRLLLSADPVLVLAPPAQQDSIPPVIISASDLVAGPGQAASVVIRTEQAEGVAQIAFTLRHDATLADVGAVSLSDALPAGSTLELDRSMPGVLGVRIALSEALAAGPVDLLTIDMQIASDAAYGSVAALDVDAVEVNLGALPALAADGMQVVAHRGDADGSGTYDEADAAAILRLAVGLDTQLPAYAGVDPALLADVTGDGTISALDASIVLAKARGQDRAELPPIRPVLAAALRNDTGASGSDGLTADASIAGTVRDADGTVAALRAALDGAADFVDVTGRIAPDGTFVLQASDLTDIAGAPLAQGAHMVRLLATDDEGNVSGLVSVAFTLDTQAPALAASLTNDTGVSGADRITADPSIAAQVTDAGVLVSLRGGLDAAPAFDLLADLQPDGTLLLSHDRLDAIFGGALPDGAHVLNVTASDAAGNIAPMPSLAFELDTIAPLAPDFDLAPASDSAPAGDGATTEALVTLNGLTSPSASVELLGSLVIATADATGAFSLSNVALALGANALTVRATDVAGNRSEATRDIARLPPEEPSGPPITAFGLSATSDTGALGDGQTAAGVVTLVGQTQAGATLLLVGRGLQTIAGADGSFQLPGVQLAAGANAFPLRATDGAGRSTERTLTVTRLDATTAVDPVLEWNQVALDAIRIDASAPPVATRGLAMLHAAIYDVVNAIDGTPGLYVAADAQPGTSAEAGIAAAAHAILAYLYPAQDSALDAALAATLARVEDAAAEQAGVALGETVAQAMIALRAGDGWDEFVEFPGGQEPGAWRPTAPMYDVALLPQWASLDPFIMSAPEQFRPDGPPALGSAEYAAAFAEVKALGEAASPTRTAEQTQIARFWADGAGTITPPGHWNTIAAQLAASQGLSVSASARLFAQLDLALADASIMSWDAKYAYGFWRPITAIHEAEGDGNAQTAADADWQPLLITPPFPDYVSGHSTYSAAAAEILAATFGDATAFTIGSPSLPGVERSFSSFSAAAAEAGRSRIYGGIHFEFANQDGQAAGREVARWVLDRFALDRDVRAPAVIVEAPGNGRTVAQNFTVSGRVLDNLSGVASLTQQLDNGVAAAVTLDAQGRFSVPLALPLDGSVEGVHVLRLVATDAAGNAASPVTFGFTLDTRAPVLQVAAPAQDAVVNGGSRVSGIADGTGSSIAALHYRLDGGEAVPITFDPATGQFDHPIDFSALDPGTHQLSITAADSAGNAVTVDRTVNLPARVPFTVSGVAPSSGAEEVGTTFRPQVFFSRAVDVATLTADSLYATGPSGLKLAATIVPGGEGRFAWLFFADPLPGSANITLHVDGSRIRAAGDGALLDADGDGTAGGVLRTSFTTVSLTPLLGTSLSGRVFDPGPDLRPMTFDDVRAGPDGALHTADDVFLNPIAGARVFILGLEDQAVFTDAQGRFRFDSAPAGNVKVAIDGRTATNAPAGFFWPEMVMDATLQAGRANTLMGSMGSLEERQANANRDEVYLPRLRTAILETVSGDAPVTIRLDAESGQGLSAQEQQQLTLTLDPGSLMGHDGQPLAQGQVGISLVPPELVRDMLPPGVLQHTFDITIQAPGVDRFATPAQLTFPNVFDAAPGTKLNFLSFDHTTGRLVIEGTATVSADGQTVTTDPGTGITRPGWHGLVPPQTPYGPGRVPPDDDGGGGAPCDPSELPTIDVTPVARTLGVQDYFFTDDKGFFTLSFGNDAPRVDPSKDACEGDNAKSTPLVVEISVEGPADTFLEGLANDVFELLPGEQTTIRVDVTDLLGRLSNAVLRDRLFGAKVTIKGYQFGKPSDLRIDEQIYIYRYLDALDADHDDGIVEIADTATDGFGGISRSRELAVFTGPTPGPQLLTVGASDFSVEQIQTSPDQRAFRFDPAGEPGLDRTGTVRVMTPENQVAGEIHLRADAVIQNYWVDTAAFLNELLALSTDPGLSSVERALLDTPEERANVVGGAIAQAGILLGSVAGSVVLVPDPGPNTIRFDSFETPPGETSYGSAGIVDNTSDVYGGVWGLVTLRPSLTRPVQDFLLSEMLNEQPGGKVEIYTRNYFVGEDFTTQQDAVNTFGKTIAHEVGHHLGLHHTDGAAQIDIPGAAVDIMAQGADMSALFSYAITLQALMVASGDQWTSAQQALDYFGAYFEKVAEIGKKFDGPAGGPADPDVGDLEQFGAAAWIVESTDDTLLAQELSLGTVVVDGTDGEQATRSFEIVNVGDQALVIGSLSVNGDSPGFSVSGIVPGSVIAAGSRLPFTLTFDPRESGDASASLRLVSNSVGGEYIVELSGSGVVEDGDLRLEIANNNLGGQQVGAGAVARHGAAVLRNVGLQPLSITGVRIATGQGEGEFAVIGLPGGLGMTTPLVLAPGATFDFDLSFDPSAVGLQRGTIEILSDDADTPVLRHGIVGTGLSDAGTALDYGNDYVAVEQHLTPGAQPLRVVSDGVGRWNIFLPPDTAVHHVIFDPVSGLVDHGWALTAASGQATEFLRPVFQASTAPDTDFDGLPDDIEFAIGTAKGDTDTDNDGISDLAEIQQGLDPLGGLGLPVGVVSAVTVKGEALDVEITGSAEDAGTLTAYVATGSHGLAIVDVSQPTTPILLGEIDLPGLNSEVAVDAQRGLAAVAAGTFGLHVLDISGPSAPALLRTVNVTGGVGHVVTLDGIAYATNQTRLVAIDMVTGEVRQQLELGGTLTDVALEGRALYTMSEAGTLRVVSIDGVTMAARGSILMANTGGELFIGDGIAYAAGARNSVEFLFVGGFATADVSDPDAPVLLSGIDIEPPVLAPGRAIVANGSGLAVLAGSARSTTDPLGQDHALDVVSVTDPTDTAAFVTRVPLPATPRNVALSAGFAFVANDTAGLQIVSYVPLDVQGEAPTVSISASPEDANPAAPGVQVLGGRSVTVNAQVRDDVQVRTVELLVNGQVVSSDVSFPWDLLARAPVVNQPGTSLTIQVRVTDTGGNSALSNVLTFPLVADVVAPALIASTPADGDANFGGQSIDLRFDEALDAALLDVAGVTLLALGGDGLAGTPDDVVVAIASLQQRDAGRLLTLVPGAALGLGAYRLSVDDAILADVAGNRVAADVVLSFAVPAAHPIRAVSGTPAQTQFASANVGQEIALQVPFDPELAALAYRAVGGDGVVTDTPQFLRPHRTDPATRTAYFIVPVDATTGEVTLFGSIRGEIQDLPNWAVTRGAVLVAGRDIFGIGGSDFPDNGLYLTLSSLPEGGSRLESRQVFDLAPGQYELSFDLAGPRSLQTGSQQDTVNVSLGTVFSESFTRTNTQASMATFTRTIDVAQAQSARLVFDQPDINQTGLRLDNVRLRRVDTGVALLDDAFDLPSTAFLLQIVPVVTGVDVTSITTNATANVTVDGQGFVDGGDSRYRFGAVEVADVSATSGPDVVTFINASDLAGNPINKAQTSLNVALSDAAYGDVVVTTAGGTSAPFRVTLASLSTTALSGTAANAALPSANPGQAVQLVGAGLSTGSDLILQYRNSSGEPRLAQVSPAFANLSGTTADVVLPAFLNGVTSVRMLGSDAALPLQIVPLLDTVSVGSTGLRATGRGFLEDDSTWLVGNAVIADPTATPGSPDVQAGVVDNAVATMDFPLSTFGVMQVRTPGGTSAPIAWDSLTPSAPEFTVLGTRLVPALLDVAVDAARGHVLVAELPPAGAAALRRVDALTGATVDRFDLPAPASSFGETVGLHVLTAPITLNGIPVAAGNLLATLGGSARRIVAINLDPGAGAVGSVLAQLDPAAIASSSAAVLTPGGNLLVLDDSADQLVSIDPGNGAAIGTLLLPVDLAPDRNGMALHPTRGTLWVGSIASQAVFELDRATGTLLQRVDLSAQGVAGAITGLTFDADGRLLISTSGGVVHRVRIEPQAAPPAPSITGVVSAAPDGVPADSGIASANAGQLVAIQGTNLRRGDLQVLVPTRNEAGVTRVVALAPLAVNDAGTLAQVLLPELASTGEVRVAAIGSRNLGFGSAVDQVHRGITLTFTPGSETATLHFADGGLQGFNSETWGLDNVRVTRGGTTVFEDDFEGGAKAQWSSGAIESEAAFELSRFSGRFQNATQTLALTGLTPGEAHTLTFDLYVLDEWDGLTLGGLGPDRFVVVADGRKLYDEAFSASQTSAQTVTGAGSVRLQIVPTLSGQLRPWEINMSDFVLTGSGFMEGASTISFGGTVLRDHVNETVQIASPLLDPDVRDNSGNRVYRIASSPLRVNGPLRVTTDGGHFETPLVFSPQTPRTIERIESVALQGTPASPALPSANTGQSIVIVGNGTRFDSAVQFTATDNSGTEGSRTITSVTINDALGRRIEVDVPAIARTGAVKVLGAPEELYLQIVPTLRGVSPLTPGALAILEGTGMPEGELVVTVDGQPVTIQDVQTVLDGPRDQQFVTFTVPATIGAGVVTVSTSGGSATLRAAVMPQLVPLAEGNDAGDTLATALQIDLPENGRVDIAAGLQPRNVAPPQFPFPIFAPDADVYRFELEAGDRASFYWEPGAGPDAEVPYSVSLLDASGNLINNDGSAAGLPRRLDFAPATSGTYYLQINGSEPGVDPDTGEPIIVSLPYELSIKRVQPGSTTITGMLATAASGTPRVAGLPSANSGQVVTLLGHGFNPQDQVAYSGPGFDGLIASSDVDVAADGSSLTFVVPTGGTGTALTGSIRIAGESAGVVLQHVPVISAVDVRPGGEVELEVAGAGNSESWTLHFGDAAFPGAVLINHFIGILVLPQGAPLGPISISTPGGTSAAFDLALDQVVATAAQGTPANASAPSANPGQLITLTGSGLRPAPGDFGRAVLFTTVDPEGNIVDALVEAASVNAAGTALTVVVPDNAITGRIGIVGDRNGKEVVLQIVPVVESVQFPGGGTVQLTGKGLIEGHDTLYRLGDRVLIDASVSSAGFDVFANNTRAILALPQSGAGTLTVTTAGGISAPVAWTPPVPIVPLAAFVEDEAPSAFARMAFATLAGAGAMVSLPATLRANPGDTISVPVLIDDAEGMEAADLQIGYDPGLLEVTANGIHAGALIGDGLLASNLDAYAGTIRLAAALGTPREPGGGTLVEIEFRVREAAAAGGSALLDLRRVALNEGNLPLALAPQPGPDASDGAVLINTAPVAEDEGYSVAHGGSLSVPTVDGVLTNDTDADGDALTAFLVEGPAHGTLTLEPDGAFTYTAQSGFSGQDFFRYRASDGIAQSVATATIDVAPPVNSAPVFTSTPPVTFDIPMGDAAGGDAVLYLQDASALEFRLEQRRGGARGEVGLYRVQDAAGRVNGLLPGAAGYEHAALAPANRVVLFEGGDRAGESAQASLTGGYYAFYLVRGRDEAVLLSVQEGNADRSDRVRGSIAGGTLRIGWEANGSLNHPDFADLVLTARLPAAVDAAFVQPRRELLPLTTFSQSVAGDRVLQVPAGNGGEISAAFSRLKHSAGYDSEFGIYRVDDASGRIGTLAPGDAGYAQAALARATSVFSPDAVEGGASRIELLPGAFYGFYLVADGSRERFLARNPSDSLHARPLAYFSFEAANPDRFDHVRGTVSQGVLTLAWEDQLFGGDRDFNDERVQIRLEQMPRAPVFEYRAQAQDSDGDALAYSLLSGPAGATIDPLSGLLRWRAQAGQYEFVIRVDDGRGGSAEQRFTLSVAVSSPLPKPDAPAPLIDWKRQATGPAHRDAPGWRSGFVLDGASDEAEGKPNGKLRVTLPLRAQIAKAS